MPQLRKLSPAEVHTLEYQGSDQRQRQETTYDRLLEDFQVGDYGIAELVPGEKRPTVYTRLRAAALRRGLTLHFLRTSGDALRFRVEDDRADAEAG
jgi:hypothetical protein